MASGRIPELFAKIRDGQAPEQFTQQLLKDWQFGSSNDRALIPILKAIGFLSSEGKPTPLYHEYRDHSKSKRVLGHALRQSYGDIFLIKEHPTPSDKDVIQGKFKSYHNVSDHVANQMARTFLSLISLADLSPDSVNGNGARKKGDADESRNGENDAHDTDGGDDGAGSMHRRVRLHAPGLHYNIQIHLPASKDVEVYNAIFKSLRGHLLED